MKGTPMRFPSHLVPLCLVPVAALTSCGSSGHSQSFSNDGGGGDDSTGPGGDSGADSGDDSTAPIEGGSDSGGDGSHDSGATCTGGKISCGGKCVDPTSDPSNCGACNVKCAGTGAACCAGTCVTGTASCSFSVTGASPASGAVNGGDYVTITGKGFAAGMQILLDGAPAPTLVQSATSALIQTPPDVVGAKDITIRKGASAATLPKAFTYTKGSIQLPWQEIKMSVVRGEDPGLGVVQDNRVLIAGGTTVPDSTTDALSSAEIFVRTTNKVGPASGAMAIPRWQNSAIPIMSGKVLVVGGACDYNDTGCNPATDATKAELFDPKTNTFATTSHPMTTARNYPRAVLLADGRVLVSSANSMTADVYDPVADSFTQVPTLAIHTFGFMVRLRDGRALLGAGDGTQLVAELFDPTTDTFTMAAPLHDGRSMLTAHTLPDGRVMAIGGASVSAGGVNAPQDSVELYDPVANTWTVATYKLSTPRCWHASALVRDGTVVVMGGYNVDLSCTLTVASQNVDQIDPSANTVGMFGTLPNPNTEWNAVTLLDGSVIGVGGGACGTSMALPDVYFLQGMK
jgi:hypothetical protein